MLTDREVDRDLPNMRRNIEIEPERDTQRAEALVSEDSCRWCSIINDSAEVWGGNGPEAVSFVFISTRLFHFISRKSLALKLK